MDEPRSPTSPFAMLLSPDIVAPTIASGAARNPARPGAARVPAAQRVPAVANSKQAPPRKPSSTDAGEDLAEAARSVARQMTREGSEGAARAERIDREERVRQASEERERRQPAEMAVAHLRERMRLEAEDRRQIGRARRRADEDARRAVEDNRREVEDRRRREMDVHALLAATADTIPAKPVARRSRLSRFLSRLIGR